MSVPVSGWLTEGTSALGKSIDMSLEQSIIPPSSVSLMGEAAVEGISSLLMQAGS